MLDDHPTQPDGAAWLPLMTQKLNHPTHTHTQTYVLPPPMLLVTRPLPVSKTKVTPTRFVSSPPRRTFPVLRCCCFHCHRNSGGCAAAGGRRAVTGQINAEIKQNRETGSDGISAARHHKDLNGRHGERRRRRRRFSPLLGVEFSK